MTEAGSDGTPPKRARGRPFPPGVSGNPSGRPKIPAEVRDAARAHTVEALETLARLMREGDTDGVRLRAAEALLDRAWGRPLVSAELSGPGGEPLHGEHREIALEIQLALDDPETTELALRLTERLYGPDGIARRARRARASAALPGGSGGGDDGARPLPTSST